MKKIIPILTLFVVSTAIGQDFKATVKSYLEQNQKQFQLEQQDISDVSISSESYSKSLKAYNVYADQNYRGIKVFNSVSPFVVKDGKVLKSNISFIPHISAKVNSSSPSITALGAISKATSKLGIPSPNGLRLLETLDKQSYVFSNGNISLENIPVQLVYQPMNDGTSLRLAWDLSIYLLDGSHFYSVRVDASNGELLEVHDWVTSCDYGDVAHTHDTNGSVLFTGIHQSTFYAADNTTPQYRVFPIPLIGPHDGADQLVSDPAHPVASPYGWHDTDGEPGHEYTTTRGNNVLANEDHAGNNVPGEQAEGGPEMLFDFPYDLPRDPLEYTDAAVTNLFYMNNIMHDVFYQYGFDEESGNFQFNNYGNGGNALDNVIAEAQDGSGMNNANFATGPDGMKGRMQMYLWSPPRVVMGQFLTINGGPLEGSYYSVPGSFVPELLDDPITADMVLMESDDEDPYVGCGTVLNAAELEGKIAVFRRGECNFVDKIMNAQNAGAIAVVVINNDGDDPSIMGGDSEEIVIPGLMIYKRDGEEILSALLDGETINATLFDDGSGMDTNRRDGDLDNVIVAHEYGHGISIRLTGGRLNAGCLQNAEQMGEGWSDYFAIMLTMKEGDKAEDSKGIGTYSTGQGRGAKGIRNRPYSTDFEKNNFTYNNIKTEMAPHGVGSVWATMLWDMTWAFIDEYGFDPDIYDGQGGNNMALQLVIDGLKLQPCSPGFVDGRDAILEADEIANGGANKCLIWEAFAKRGLGFSADQGSSRNKQDGTEAFDLPEECSLGVNNQDFIKNKFVIYPNPSNGEFNIKSRLDVQDAIVTIYDMNGRKVFTQEVDIHQDSNINASTLNAGIYMVQIDGGGYSQTSKLIIK